MITVNFEPIQSIIKKYSVYLLLVVAGILLILAWLVLGPKPFRIHTVNVNSNSFGVTWVTSKPVTGCIWWGRLWRPGIHLQCEEAESRAHLVEIKRLEQNRPYWYVIVGQGRIYLGSLTKVTTFIQAVQPPLPQPAYGSIVDVKGNPISKGIILVYPQFVKDVYPQAVRANAYGNFVVDIGKFADLENNLIIEGGAGLNQWEAQVVNRYTTPFPPLEVSTNDF